MAATGTPRTTDKSLVPMSSITTALDALKDPDFQAMIKDITVFDLPRYTTAAGTSNAFGNGSKEIVGVILEVVPQRVFWASEFGQASRPVCVARDGMHGEPDPLMVQELGINPPPGGPCLQCPYADFGSLAKYTTDPRRKTSRAAACSDVRHIFVYQVDEEPHALPAMIKCAPTSLANLRKYQVGLMDKLTTLAQVVTRVTIGDGHSAGFDYGVLKFDMLGRMEGDALAGIKAYRAEVGPWLRQATILQENVLTCADCDFQWVAPPEDKCPSCGLVIEEA